MNDVRETFNKKIEVYNLSQDKANKENINLSANKNIQELEEEIKKAKILAAKNYIY